MSFTRIANEITKHCKVLDEYIALEKLPVPSMTRDGPLEFPVHDATPPEVLSSRTALLDTAQLLHDLVAGPAAMLVWPALTYPYQLATVRMLQKFSIPEAVSLKEATSFKSIAVKTGINEELASRIIKHASAYNIFSVDEHQGLVSHTSPSRALVEHEAVKASLQICLDDRFLATAGLVDRAFQRYGVIDESRGTAFNLAFETEVDYLSWIMDDSHSKELGDMGKFLGFVFSGTNMGARAHDMLLLAGDLIDWDALGEGLVVDMGGGFGHVSASIAKHHPRLRFLVQDLPDVVLRGRSVLLETAEGDAAVAARIELVEHDFLTPQTVTDAEIFMFRFVMHDWSDKYVLRILQNIIPAMKPGARIVIMDYVAAVLGSVPKVVEKLERTMDMLALSIIAGKERTSLDWNEIIEKTGNRLRIIDIHANPLSAFGLVVLGLQSE